MSREGKSEVADQARRELTGGGPNIINRIVYYNLVLMDFTIISVLEKLHSISVG